MDRIVGYMKQYKRDENTEHIVEGPSTELAHVQMVKCLTRILTKLSPSKTTKKRKASGSVSSAMVEPPTTWTSSIIKPGKIAGVLGKLEKNKQEWTVLVTATAENDAVRQQFVRFNELLEQARVASQNNQEFDIGELKVCTSYLRTRLSPSTNPKASNPKASKPNGGANGKTKVPTGECCDCGKTGPIFEKDEDGDWCIKCFKEGPFENMFHLLQLRQDRYIKSLKPLERQQYIDSRVAIDPETGNEGIVPSLKERFEESVQRFLDAKRNARKYYEEWCSIAGEMDTLFGDDGSLDESDSDKDKPEIIFQDDDNIEEGWGEEPESESEESYHSSSCSLEEQDQKEQDPKEQDQKEQEQRNTGHKRAREPEDMGTVLDQLSGLPNKDRNQLLDQYKEHMDLKRFKQDMQQQLEATLPVGPCQT
jgi:hypothetical protein